MTDDTELLRRYAADRSEAALAELVDRHVDLVYSAALRQMAGDHHRAQDVTQMVFTDLSRKAAALVRHPLLPAWFHRSCHLAALSLRRKEGRRQKYERAAGFEAGMAGSEGNMAAWDDVRPVLDEAINQLNEGDRHAILLRFFANRPFGEVGRQLSLTENAARMRVERALGKLRELLARRGITSSSAALATAIAGHAVSAAPAGVAIAATSAALAGTGAAAGTWIAFMTTSKLPLTLAAAALLTGASVVTLQERADRRAAAEMAGSSGEAEAISALQAQNQKFAADAQLAQALQADDASVLILRGQARELESKIAQAGPGGTKGASQAPTSGNGLPVFDYMKLEQRPTPVTQIRPEYPAELKEIGASGEVLVDFVVGSDGKVYNAHSISGSVYSSGALTSDNIPEFSSALKNSAVQAVSQWIFQPGQLNGQSVNTHMQVPIVFALEADPAPAVPSWF